MRGEKFETQLAHIFIPIFFFSAVTAIDFECCKNAKEDFHFKLIVLGSMRQFALPPIKKQWSLFIFIFYYF